MDIVRFLMRPRREEVDDVTRQEKIGAALACFGLRLADEEHQDDGPEAPPALEVHPDNRRACDLFLAAMHHFQLVLGGMGGVHWAAVRPSDVRQLMDWLRVPRRDQPDLWRRYGVMEQEALRLLNERAAEAARAAQG
jgi:hypothetical protein